MDNARIIVITGVTKGIGLALAEYCIAAGHRVCGCGRSADRIASLQKQYADQHFTVVDITDAEALDRWAETVVAEMGSPDLLVNNAALINRRALFHEVDADTFDQVIRVSLCGTANVTRSFLPEMFKQQRGIIVNMSSGWGRWPAAEVVPYCTAKAGVEMMTASLAKELPKGMAALTLTPGSVDTDMTVDCWGKMMNVHSPEEWVQTAGPYILGFTSEENGQALAVTFE